MLYSESIEKIRSALKLLISDQKSKAYTLIVAYLKHYENRFSKHISINLKRRFELNKDYMNKDLDDDIKLFFSIIASNDGKIPDTLLSQRNQKSSVSISSFNNKLKYIGSKLKGAFISKLLRENIEVFNGKESSSEYSFINDLFEYSKINKDNRKYCLSHGSLPHEIVLPNLVKNGKALCCELPIYLRSKNTKLKNLLGHIDLLVYQGGVFYVCDYKPDQNYNSKALVSKSFVNSIPQVAVYAMVLKNMFGLKCEIKCITFNRKGAWLYEPNAVLKEINDFMREYREVDDLPWRPYMDEF